MPTPNLQPLPEKPQAPAAAYAVMAELLGDDYFLQQAVPGPDTVVMMVIGMDGVPTQWVIPRGSVGAVIGRLRASGRVRLAQQIPNLGLR